MNGINFFLLFEDNLELFLITTIPVVLLFICLANKVADSWMNPVKLTIFTVGIGIGVASFLFVLGEVSNKVFLYVTTCSLLYGLILCYRYPRKVRILNYTISNESFFSKNLFITLYSLNIVLTLLSYSKFGIPLFNEGSRLDTFDGSGGYGIILRLSEFFVLYSLFYLFHKFSTNKMGWISLLVWLMPLILFGVLSGSRSSFLNIIFAYWGFNKFYYGRSVFLSKYKYLVVIFLAVSIMTFAIQSATDFNGAYSKFIDRVISSGDLYWISLPNDVWKEVTIKTPFKDIFSGFLVPLRLISEYDAGIGLQLFQIITKDYNQIAGPNEFFPVSSLIYFGYFGGLIFVVFQTHLASALARLFFRQSKSIILSSILYYSFLKSIVFLSIFRDAVGYMFNVFINVVFVFFLILLLSVLFHKSFRIEKRIVIL